MLYYIMHVYVCVQNKIISYFICCLTYAIVNRRSLPHKCHVLTWYKINDK